MHEAGLVLAIVGAELAWITIWAALLHVLGLARFLGPTEDLVLKRERLKRIGQAKYILMFGVMGAGVLFAGMMVTIDLLWRSRSLQWEVEVFKFVLLAMLYGSFMGYRNWQRTFDDPTPYPPNYSPEK
ncbi:MAG TPA: hypothetical protein VFA40_17710 [Terriglobales bacterium]|nr:hypothetical protein [Terriglobales bacterium]